MLCFLFKTQTPVYHSCYSYWRNEEIKNVHPHCCNLILCLKHIRHLEIMKEKRSFQWHVSVLSERTSIFQVVRQLTGFQVTRTLGRVGQSHTQRTVCTEYFLPQTAYMISHCRTQVHSHKASIVIEIWEKQSIFTPVLEDLKA